jgi:hypothetical protein
MLLVLLKRPGEDSVIQVGKTEVESMQNVVHEALLTSG